MDAEKGCKSNRLEKRRAIHTSTANDTMKRLIPLTLLILSIAAAAQADERYGKQKVIYHVNFDDLATQVATLANIQNHINAVGAENLELKVVMHGDGVSLLLEPDALKDTKMKAANATDEIQAKISGLKDQGIKFEICANTLKGRSVPMDALYDVSESDIVPSGVAELARLQQLGYAYIKP